MEEVILVLLHTFQGTGDGTTEAVTESTQYIQSKISSEEAHSFYQNLLTIIIDSQSNSSIKLAALNVLIQGERNYPDYFPYDLILSSIIQLLQATTSELRSSVSFLLDSVVSHTIFTDLFGNPIEILSTLFEQDLIGALILSNSISDAFAHVNDEQLQVYQEISNYLLTILSQILEQRSYLYSAYCLSTGFNFMKSKVPSFFGDNPENLSIWLHYALECQNVSEDNDYNLFTQKALKFINQILYKSSGNYPTLELIPEDGYDIFDCAAALTTFQNPPETQSILSETVDQMITNKHTWNMMSCQMETVVQYVFMPFFTLTVEEIEYLKSDKTAANFISSVFTTPLNSSDPRMYLHGKINLHCRDENKSKIIGEAVSTVLTSLYNIYAESSETIDDMIYTFFSSLLFFSSVGYSMARNNQELANSMLSLFVNLLENSDNLLLKIGSLVAIDSFSIELPDSVITVFLSFLADENCQLLLRYFSCQCFSNSISLVSEESDLKNAVISEIDTILKSFVSLADSFNDIEFFRGLSKFVKCFGKVLSQDDNVTQLLLEIYIINFDHNRPEKSNAALSALSCLLPYLQNQTQIELLQTVCNSAVENSLISNELLDFTANLIALQQTITDEIWTSIKALTEVVLNGTEYSQPLYFLSSFSIVLKNLIIKTSSNIESYWDFLWDLINFLLENSMNTQDSNVVNPTLQISFTICNVLKNNLPENVIGIFSQICEQLMNDNRYFSYVSILYSSLIISTKGNIINQEMFNYWIENSSYFELIVVLLNCPEVYGDNYFSVICKILTQITEDISRPLFGDEEAYYQNISPTEFTVNELSFYKEHVVMKDFANLLKNLPEEQRNVIQAEVCQKDVNDIAKEITNFFDAKTNL
ncbi:hypothetical protein TVAG_407910 [Trichomonas vaginalis G3]|uniref:Uncharacterized protein n=1 Tax=Trichomonas vaginalis (strain ATCC PRA-98 / G3) TaxID=412133 RepID=A2FNM2_TRIV3|nr:armadillo (ARM) repeat-containing protein family [Trichomonas vaginalis G3]EAX93490.1 hypothetical protein TVAG_407910 [Trichomonas vaginalis G3]KAI5533648.1 armadillo (ARM) repeat-containing protein family [Trichomonas vaginalis G3]|eukprot:XP_001306420.1 hypothetical protein [Trichomonas vaginalis G3]